MARPGRGGRCHGPHASRDLRVAVRRPRAGIGAFSGLGATLPDGHRHEVRWSPTDLEAQLLLVQDAARTAGRTPVAQDWGISSYAVRESAVSDLEPVLALLTEAGHLPG